MKSRIDPPAHFEAMVFTDLDGTLLDHETYSHGPAAEALSALSAADIPLVLCSSKTRAEILSLQKILNISGPFISENGGGAFLSGGGRLKTVFPEIKEGLPAKIFGRPYRELRSALERLRAEFGTGIRGFGDMGVEEVAENTGLGIEQARLAMSRDFDEPFVWTPAPRHEEKEIAREILSQLELGLTRGGRFWHIVGENDKGKALRWLLDALEEKWGTSPKSLSLGDSENDLPMLLAADEGVLVERPGGGHLHPRPRAIFTTVGVGPTGWNKAVLSWIRRLDSYKGKK